MTETLLLPPVAFVSIYLLPYHTSPAAISTFEAIDVENLPHAGVYGSRRPKPMRTPGKKEKKSAPSSPGTHHYSSPGTHRPASENKELISPPPSPQQRLQPIASLGLPILYLPFPAGQHQSRFHLPKLLAESLPRRGIERGTLSNLRSVHVCGSSHPLRFTRVSSLARSLARRRFLFPLGPDVRTCDTEVSEGRRSGRVGGLERLEAQRMAGCHVNVCEGDVTLAPFGRGHGCGRFAHAYQRTVGLRRALDRELRLLCTYERIGTSAI